MEISLPSEDELKALYDAAEAYAKVAGDRWERWNHVKEEALQRDADISNSWASSIAYSDAEYKILRAQEEVLFKRADAIVADINNRFPGLKLVSPAIRMSYGGYVSEKYIPAVRRDLWYYVHNKWRDANHEKLTALWAQIRKIKERDVSTLKLGMVVLTEWDKPSEIVKITHNGKRVITRRLFTGKETLYRPGDKLRRISRKLAEEFLKHEKSHQEIMERHGLTDAKPS